MRYTALALALVASAAFGQAPAPLSFEVASIKPAAPSESGQNRYNRVGIDRIAFEYVTLRYCLAFAYGVKDYQISGPDWLADSRWQISAKAPEGSRREQLPEMMQALLAERFQVQVHRETKELPGFALVVGKNGPKLKPATATAQGGRGGYRMSMTVGGGGKIEASGLSMALLATTLSNLLARPVADLTGLAGEYEFSLQYAAYEARHGVIVVDGPPPPASDLDPGVSVFTSIQKLGLKLDTRKVPVEMIVVDRAGKTPTGN